MKRVWDIVTRKQTSTGSAAAILITMVFTSRIFGLVRDRLLAARFAPEELGVYFAAFRLPNLIFELLVMGALTSAFIPVFTTYLTRGKVQEGWQMTSILINIGVCVLGFASLPVIIWAEPISRFFAPGFNKSEISAMTQFTQIMLIFQVFPLLVGNFFTGVLQSYSLFLIPALAPVVYNIGIIAGILVLTPCIGLFAPVIGVAFGALLFMIIQVPLLARLGYQHSLSLNYRNAGVREVARLIGPRTFGLAVSQIDSTIDLMLSSMLGARMVTVFNFAQQLQQLPVGLFGASIAQATLPSLSAASAKNDIGQFRSSIIRAVHQMFFFILPLSVFFIVLRIPIVRLVFGAARFDWQATFLTGVTLSMFSISLFAQSMTHIFARGFYALHDTKTPVTVSVISIILNSAASIMFIRIYNFPVWSLGLSTSIASIVNATLLLFLLDRRIGTFLRREFFISPIKMFVAAILAGITVFIPLKLFDQLIFDTTRTIGLILLTATAGSAGLCTYVAISWLFNIGEVHSFIALMRRTKKVPILFEPASEVIADKVQNKLS